MQQTHQQQPTAEQLKRLRRHDEHRRQEQQRRAHAEQQRFLDATQQMMFGFGDSDTPCEESVALVGALAKQHVERLTAELVDIARATEAASSGAVAGSAGGGVGGVGWTAERAVSAPGVPQQELHIGLHEFQFLLRDDPQATARVEELIRALKDKDKLLLET